MLDKKLRELMKRHTITAGKTFGRFLTPNQMTMATLLLGIITAKLIYVELFLLAAITLFLSGVTDWLDGAIAKTMKKTTKFGAILDSAVDKFTELLVYTALALTYSRLVLPSFLAAAMMMWSSYINQCCKLAGLEKGMGFLQRKERMFFLILLLMVLEFIKVPNNSIALLISSFILYTTALLSFITGMQRLYLTYKKVG